MVDPIHADDEPLHRMVFALCVLEAIQSAHLDTGPSAWVSTGDVRWYAYPVCYPKCSDVALWVGSLDEIDPILLAEWTQNFEQSGYNHATLIKTFAH